MKVTCFRQIRRRSRFMLLSVTPLLFAACVTVFEPAPFNKHDSLVVARFQITSSGSLQPGESWHITDVRVTAVNDVTGESATLVGRRTLVTGPVPSPGTWHLVTLSYTAAFRAVTGLEIDTQKVSTGYYEYYKPVVKRSYDTLTVFGSYEIVAPNSFEVHPGRVSNLGTLRVTVDKPFPNSEERQLRQSSGFASVRSAFRRKYRESDWLDFEWLDVELTSGE